MLTTINEHGETETIIGSKTDGRGGRTLIKVVEFVCCGRPCFALHCGSGAPDARRFSTQVKRAKAKFEHPSNQAEWYC